MFCPHCGKQVNETDIFCASCGANLNGNPSESQFTQQKESDNPPYNPPQCTPYETQSNPNPNTSTSTNTNAIAIVGFVLSFFCAIAGLVCSIIGLQKSKEAGGTGKGLAIAGIVISAVSMFCTFIFMIDLCAFWMYSVDYTLAGGFLTLL